jgi:hypothetical protein
MASAVAAIIIRHEKDLVAHFRATGSLTPDSAKSLSALGSHTDVAFRRLQRRAVIRESNPGFYYLDEPSWQAHQAARRRIMLLLVSLVILGIAAALWTARAG